MIKQFTRKLNKPRTMNKAHFFRGELTSSHKNIQLVYVLK